MNVNSTSINIECDILIIGGGPAGLSAGIYAGRSAYKTEIICTLPGGQLNSTSSVANYPGCIDIKASDLIANLTKQVVSTKTNLNIGAVDSVFCEKGHYYVDAGNKKFKAKTLIIATGSNNKLLEIANIKKFINKGVHVCVVSDAIKYREKLVAVVGGGNQAFAEALMLSKYAKRVYLIHRNKKYKAERELQDRVRKNDKIEELICSEVEDIIARQGKFAGIVLKNNLTNETKSMHIDGIFVAIGVIPNTILFKNILKLTKTGHIKIFENTRTSNQGIYACGEVVENSYRQASTAAASGVMAAIDAIKYLDRIKN